MTWSAGEVPSLGALAFAALPEAALLVEPGGSIILVNDAWEQSAAARLLGVEASVGSRFAERLGGWLPGTDELTATLGQVQAMLRGERDALDVELHRSGDAADSTLALRLRRGPAGAERFTVVTVEDVTEARRTAAELRQKQAHWAAIGRAQDRLGIGFAIVERDRVVFANEVLARLTGLTNDELLALPSLAGVTTLESHTRLRVALAPDLANGARPINPFEAALRHRGGSEVPVEIAVSRVVLGGHERSVALIRDLSGQKRSERRLWQANAELTRWVRELERRGDDVGLLREMHHLLLAASTIAEAYTVVAYYLGRLLPNTAGSLTSVDEQAGNLDVVAHWGEPAMVSETFPRERCWAIRLGQPHRVDFERSALLCPHFAALQPSESTLCVPLTARGEALGVLHLRRSATSAGGGSGGFSEPERQLADTAAEQVALALSNLRLQESLRNQSIRDAMTGLFNRRYLEETLERELRQATRHERSVGLIMADIDRFKRVNDQFGHDAGDMVIREIGQLLRESVRAGDIACRYGGEEFALVLPEASLEDTRRRADQLAEVARDHRITYRGESVGKYTLSLGVAACPEHGFTAQLLLLASDRALYRAKRAGGDRAVVAD